MKPAGLELWQKIEHFPLDEPGVAEPFSRRLARERGWSAAFVAGAMFEYRRFLFLAANEAQQMTPSKVVDDVWHLHLLYTESYWERLCQTTLARPLHHCPSVGGQAEAARFSQQYGETLRAYREVFGEEPPSRFWPRREPSPFRRWFTPGIWLSGFDTFRRRYLGHVSVIAAGMFLSGCSMARFADAGYNVFDLRGPDFLGFFVVLSLLCFASAAVMRYRNRRPYDIGEMPLADPYQLAYLSHGVDRVLHAAVACLAKSGSVAFLGKGSKSLSRVGPLPNEPHWIEKWVWAQVPESKSIELKDLKWHFHEHGRALEATLRNKGYFVDESALRAAHVAPLLLSLLPVLVGSIKISVGLSRGRPVIYLLVGVVFTLIMALLVFAKRPMRSRRGDAALDRVKSDVPGFLPRNPSPDEIALFVALFGPNILFGSPLENVARSLLPPTSSGGDSGGSSCGGGGSCGGGSGCGGCGGGGH